MSSWFYKLRRKRGGAIAAGDPDDGLGKQPVAPAPSPCSPNRASYYVPSRERARPAGEDNPKLRDTHFPRSPQPSDIVFDVVAARRHDRRFKDDMPELKLRPIVTRPAGAAAMADDSSSAAASPTARVRRPRFHTKPAPQPPSRRRKAAAEEEGEACARRRRRRSASRLRSWMCESLVVVKESAEPEEDFLESMAEMIAANGVCSPRGLEDLLACYLALNAPDHHRAIVAAFRRAWVHLHSMPPAPAARGLCIHEARLD